MGLGDRPSIRQVEGSNPEILARSRLMDYFRAAAQNGYDTSRAAAYDDGPGDAGSRIADFRRYILGATAGIPATGFDAQADAVNFFTAPARAESTANRRRTVLMQAAQALARRKAARDYRQNNVQPSITPDGVSGSVYDSRNSGGPSIPRINWG